jgi:hypothetical protein
VCRASTDFEEFLAVMTKESKDALAAVLPVGAALPLSASSGDLISMSAAAAARDGMGGSNSDLRSDYSEGGATPSVAGGAALISIYSSGYLPGLDPGHGAAGAGAGAGGGGGGGGGRGAQPAPLTAVMLPSVRPGGGAAGASTGLRLIGSAAGAAAAAGGGVVTSAEDVTSGSAAPAAVPGSAFSSPTFTATDGEGGAGAVRFTARVPSHSLDDGVLPAGLTAVGAVNARLAPYGAGAAVFSVAPPPLPHPPAAGISGASDGDGDVGLTLDGHTPAGGSPAASSAGLGTPPPAPQLVANGAAGAKAGGHGHGHGHGHSHSATSAPPHHPHHHPHHPHHPAALAAKHASAAGRPSSPLAQTVFPLAAALPVPQRAASYDSVASNGGARAGHTSPPVSPHSATPVSTVAAGGSSGSAPDRIAAPRTSSTASASGGGAGGGSGAGSSTSSIGRASAALAAGLRAAVNSAGLGGVVVGGAAGPGAEPLLPLHRPGKRASFKDGASTASTVSMGGGGGGSSVAGSGAASTRTVSGIMDVPCFKPAAGQEEGDSSGYVCEIDDTHVFAAAAAAAAAAATATAVAVAGEGAS